MCLCGVSREMASAAALQSTAAGLVVSDTARGDLENRATIISNTCDFLSLRNAAACCDTSLFLPLICRERSALFNPLPSLLTGGGLAVGTVLLIGETENPHFNQAAFLHLYASFSNFNYHIYAATASRFASQQMCCGSFLCYVLSK